MWGRTEFGDDLGLKAGSSTSSPGWVPGGDSAWQVGSSSRARRHSTASDSGDTGIGTSCSDSIEDRSSSSTTLSFQPLRGSSGIPTAHVMPSPSSSAQLGAPSPSPAGSPWSSCQLPSPLDTPLDMKDPRPVRRWSSLTRLTGQEKTSPTGRVSSYRADAHGSLDRGLLYGYRQDPHNHDLSSLGFRRLSSSVASTDTSSSRYRCDPADGKTDSSCSSPLKPATLDLAYSALPESKPPTPAHRAAPGGSPIQPAVRTQMWLSEQMEFRPGPDGCGLAAWQQDRLRQEAELTQVLTNASLPVNTLVKLKEGLLRQRELEIDRQKQQILQLHSRIRENELRAKQVLQNQRGRCDEPFYLKPKDPHYEAPVPPTLLEHAAPLCGESAELGRRLAAAELEVVHLNEFLKQNTQKYTEDIKKLEEKMKTRDRYISSLKKKCQREQEQNLEKQQRVETLEKYLADLPSLDQLGGLQLQVGELQTRATDLGRSLEESRAELQDKEALIQKQQRREKELVATVQSLQAKVEQCLEDGVRLPMLDLKQLERTNTHLQEENTESSQLIDGQKKQIEKLRQDLMDVEKRLQQERTVCDELRVQLHQQKRRPVEEAVVRGVPEAAPQEAGPLLKEAGPLLEEMSLCLLDLKGLCSILTQRAQGKEPNLALLLGIKSTGLPGEENERPPLEGGLRAKLLEVCQLRKDIDELRTIISDRYAQDMGDNCVTQ